MDDTNPLPDDVTQCHRLLMAAFKQAVQLERQADAAKGRATQAEQLAAQAEQRATASQREARRVEACVGPDGGFVRRPFNKSTLPAWKNLPGTSVGFTDADVNG